MDSFSPVSSTDPNAAASNEREILDLINREYIVRWLLGTSEAVDWALFFDWVWPGFPLGVALFIFPLHMCGPVWPCSSTNILLVEARSITGLLILYMFNSRVHISLDSNWALPYPLPICYVGKPGDKRVSLPCQETGRG